MKILVVDDSSVMRSIVLKHLRKAGYADGEFEVLSASSGPEARALVVSDHPDLMITDIDMPEMTGFELVRSLRDDNIAVVFGIASAQNSQETLCEAMELGARFALHKPFDTATVKRAIKPVLDEIAEHNRVSDQLRELREANTTLKARVESLEQAGTGSTPADG